MEEQIRDAILTELKRQSEDPECSLTVFHDNGRLSVSGEIDLDALTFVMVGSLRADHSMGGP